MTSNVNLVVYGVPCPKGSPRVSKRFDKKTGKYRVTVRNDSAALDVWSQQVAWAARAAVRGQVLPVFRATALHVDVAFYLPRPETDYLKGGGLAMRAPVRPSVKPDGDKLLRGVLDPLIGLVIDEDSRFTSYRVWKLYERVRGRTGAVVHVYPDHGMCPLELPEEKR